MARHFFPFISLIFLLLVSCEQPTSPVDLDALPAIAVPWTDQQSLVCFGTSLTYGYMSVGPISVGSMSQQMSCTSRTSTPIQVVAADTTSYPALLAQLLRIKVYKQGFIGATTQDALGIVGDSVIVRNPALVLLEFSANDFLQGLDVQTVEQRLGRLIDTLKYVGCKVILISFLYPEMISSIPANHFLAGRKQDGEVYLQMLRRIAANHGILFVENAMKGIYWNSNMMSDALHPNSAGYRRMFENISNALFNTFWENAMLK